MDLLEIYDIYTSGGETHEERNEHLQDYFLKEKLFNLLERNYYKDDSIVEALYSVLNTIQGFCKDHPEIARKVDAKYWD